MAVEATPLSMPFTVQQLELMLAEHQLQEEVQLLEEDSVNADIVAKTSEAIGPIMYSNVEEV